MKSLVDYIKEEVAPALGAEIEASTFATPGNTMGMGDVKPPKPEEPGSDSILGKTKKEKIKTSKKKKEKDN